MTNDMQWRKLAMAAHPIYSALIRSIFRKNDASNFAFGSSYQDIPPPYMSKLSPRLKIPIREAEAALRSELLAPYSGDFQLIPPN